MGIIESVQQYDLNIAAGGAQNIDVAGDRVQFLSATDPFAQIEIRPNYAQGNISLKPGQGFRFSEQVTRWVVFNRGSVPLSGYLMIGSGDFFDQRIAGTVDVIDGGKARTLGGTARMGYVFQTAVAAQLAHVQLWNPAGSGRNVFLEQFNFFSTGVVANGVGARPATAALSTLSGNAQSKLLGGAASVMELRSQSAAAPIGGGVIAALDKTLKLYKLTEPITLAPGNGLNLLNGTPNEDIGVCFEFYEELA